MAPLIALLASFCLFFGIGLAGNPYLVDYHHALRPALAVMFLLTASAHWGAKRKDLVRMVPRAFSRPGILVTVTGVLEIGGAIGLLVPATAPMAALGLTLLLIAMFPANVYAARHRLTIGGRAVPKLGIRTFFQVIFIVCTLLASLH